MKQSSKIRVLVVDDSALIRKVLSDILSQDPEIEVVGTALDGTFALQKVRQLVPDVVTLDVEMKQMGGLELLEKLMQEHPLPVIMVSAHTTRGAESTFRALELGAVDFITKPQAGSPASLTQMGEDLIRKVKSARGARIRSIAHRRMVPAAAPAPAAFSAVPVGRKGDLLIAVGASTGGTEALKDFLVQLPADCPPIVIVQHMPENFTKAFANRLNDLCAIHVKEAEHGDVIVRGQALVAPGHSHLLVERHGAQLQAVLEQTPPVNRHRPSVEVLFRSVARVLRDRAIGVIMTGMGSDGAQGMLEMKQAGARTIAQNEQTCVVFGMPKEAIAAGGVDWIVPLQEIPRKIYELLAA